MAVVVGGAAPESRIQSPAPTPDAPVGFGRLPDSGPSKSDLGASAALVLVALTYGALRQGAYFQGAFRVMAALLMVATVAALARRRPTPAELLAPPMLGAGALAATTLLSAGAAGSPSTATTTVAAITAAAAVVLVTRRCTAHGRRVLASGVVAVGTLVALTGWAGVATGYEPWSLVDGGLRRAASTLTYANATASLLAVAALLCAGVLSRRGDPFHRLGLMILLAGLGATMSRAGIASLLVGGVVLAALDGARRLCRSCGPSLLGAAVALAGLLPSSAGSSETQPLVALVGLVLGVVVALAGGRSTRPGRRRRSTTALASLAAAAVAAGVVAGGAIEPMVDNRLTLTSPDRQAEWLHTWRLVLDQPWLGVGPGPFHVAWEDSDGDVSVALYTHNEYLQLAAQQGVVGVSAGLGGLVAVAAWLVRRRHHHDRQIWAGAIAGLVALLVHSALDFVWHVPVLVVLGAVVVGLASPPLTQPESDHRPVDASHRASSDRTSRKAET